MKTIVCKGYMYRFILKEIRNNKNILSKIRILKKSLKKEKQKADRMRSKLLLVPGSKND